VTDRELRATRARVLVPIEQRGRLHTADGMPYRRTSAGAIVRLFPKVRGKRARALDKIARRRSLTSNEDA
jgi:hypothetical protein